MPACSYTDKLVSSLEPADAVVVLVAGQCRHCNDKTDTFKLLTKVVA